MVEQLRAPERRLVLFDVTEKDWLLRIDRSGVAISTVLSAEAELYFTLHPAAAEIRPLLAQGIPPRQLKLLYPEVPRLQQLVIYARWLSKLAPAEIAAVQQRLDSLLPAPASDLHRVLDPEPEPAAGDWLTRTYECASDVSVLRAYTQRSRIENASLTERATLETLIDIGSHTLGWLQHRETFNAARQFNHVLLAQELTALMSEFARPTMASDIQASAGGLT